MGRIGGGGKAKTSSWHALQRQDVPGVWFRYERRRSKKRFVFDPLLFATTDSSGKREHGRLCDTSELALLESFIEYTRISEGQDVARGAPPRINTSSQ